MLSITIPPPHKGTILQIAEFLQKYLHISIIFTTFAAKLTQNNESIID